MPGKNEEEEDFRSKLENVPTRQHVHVQASKWGRPNVHRINDESCLIPVTSQNDSYAGFTRAGIASPPLFQQLFPSTKKPTTKPKQTNNFSRRCYLSPSCRSFNRSETNHHEQGCRHS